MSKRSNKTLIQIRFIDLMNHPFPNLYHEVRVSGNKYAASAGNSDSEGLGVWIEKPVGTQLDILVRNPLTKKLVHAKRRVIVPVKKGIFRVQAPFAIQQMKLRPLTEGGSTLRKTYKILPGDDLYSIAKRFGTTWQILFELNKDQIKQPDQIFPGRWIKIPPKGSSLTGKTNEKPDSLTSQTHYKVKKGETLSSISQRSGVSVQELQRINGISRPEALQAGQAIKLRGNSSTKPQTSTKPTSPVAKTKPTTSSSNEKEDGFFDGAMDTVTDMAKGTVGVIGGAIGSIGDGLGALGEKAKEGFGNITDAMSGGKKDKPVGQTNGSDNSASSTSATYTVKSGDTLSGIAQKKGVDTSMLARANGLKLTDTIQPGDELKIPKGGLSDNSSSSSNSSSQSSKTNNPINVTTKPVNSINGTPKEVVTTNGACICKAHDLIWSGHPNVTCEFRKKVIEISQDMWPDDYLSMANNLIALMHLETDRSFSPKADNGAGYVGLIQFGELARTDLNISKETLKSMSAVEQLDWVKKYFELYDRYKKVHSFLEMYLTILYPSTVTGKELKDEDIIFRDNGKIKKNNPYLANPSFMKEKNERKKEGFKGGVTYAWEVKKEIAHHYEDGKKSENRKFTVTCTKSVQPPIQKSDNLKLNPLACGGDKHYKRTLENIAALHPIFQPYVINLINEGYRQTNLTWVITDGYRSPKAQNKLSSKVTSAGALESYHQYGLAIDIVSVTNGEITYLKNNSLSIAHSKKLAPIGKNLGLVWGGVWRKPDYPHFELHPNGKNWKSLKPQLVEIGIENYKDLTFN